MTSCRTFSRVATLALVVLAGPVEGRADEASDLLEKVGAAYKTLPAYADQGEFVMVVSVDGKEHRYQQPAAITLVRPNRLKVEAGTATLVCDGKTLTTFVGPTRKVLTAPSPGVIGLHHVAEGPVGSMLMGGPSGPSVGMVLGFLLAEGPTRGVRDLGDDLACESDREVDGQPVRVLRVASPNGTKYRLLVDPATSLLKAIEVEPSAESLASSLPQGGAFKVVACGWKAGKVSTEPAPDEAFAVEPPKGFDDVKGKEAAEK